MEIIIITLIAFTIFREVLSFFERREMLDRLMAKNLTEFKDNKVVEENVLDESDRDIIDLEDAKDEITKE